MDRRAIPVDLLSWKVIKYRYSHFDGLVPVDDVPAEREGLDVDDVHVAALRAHVHPLGLQRQVQAGDPAGKHAGQCRALQPGGPLPLYSG